MLHFWNYKINFQKNIWSCLQNPHTLQEEAGGVYKYRMNAYSAFQQF